MSLFQTDDEVSGLDYLVPNPNFLIVKLTILFTAVYLSTFRGCFGDSVFTDCAVKSTSLRKRT